MADEAIKQLTSPPADAPPKQNNSLLGPLPPINAGPPPMPVMPPPRPPEEQAALEKELDEMHELLGVKRGHALQEAMKPNLEVPMPFQMATTNPRGPDVPMGTATTVPAATAPTAGAPQPAAAPEAAAGPSLPQLLALPAPEDTNGRITLDVSTGEAVTLDSMGPVVVNSDGTLSRITNWSQMSEQEQSVTKRRISKRNIERLKEFAARGELKDSLVAALEEPTAAVKID